MATDFENCKTQNQGIHYSRYIASWLNVGEKYFDEEFAEWLKANGCTDNEISDITVMATCGKMELQMNAEQFLKERAD